MENRKEIHFNIDNVHLSGELVLPDDPQGIILFSHGSGSSRFSPRNNYVARLLTDKNFGTFLFDLLTAEEDKDYEQRFNIDLLSNRLVMVTRQLTEYSPVKDIPFGFFGASTGAASAINVAVILGNLIKTIVSRGGRPDLAVSSLSKLKIPVLLIVGSLDPTVISLNEKAIGELSGEKKLEIINGASHLFEEPGKLDEVAELSIKWFKKYLIK